jgi:hypothetical protein
MLAQAAGVDIAEDANRLEEWRTATAAACSPPASAARSPATASTACSIVDDPFKNRAEAESEARRKKVWEWFNDVAYTRKEPGASVIVVMTRWHPQDLSGKLIGEKGWKYVKLPALDEDGKALWPERFPAEELAKIREQVGEYTWTSLYQGEPRSRGGKVFGDVRTYDPRTDLARLSPRARDRLRVQREDPRRLLGVHHARRVRGPLLRARRPARAGAGPGFRRAGRRGQKVRGKPQTRWYYAGPELGVAQLLTASGVEHLKALPAKSDKFVRAQPVAAAWNAGKVLVPQNAPWLDAFVAEVVSFTGVDDERDDQVDALAAAYDELNKSTPTFAGLELPRTTRRI